MSSAQAVEKTDGALSPQQRWLILVVAFLGWLFAGVHMSITPLTGQPAAIDLLARAGELDADRLRELRKQAQAKPAASELSAADRAQLMRWDTLVARWYTWFQCAFLFGAASGGLFFGWLGDRAGRSTAMAASILTYAVLAAATSFAQSPVQLCVLWFCACTGVGGMWPNGVALVAEAWSNLSRPFLAGVIGTAANIGLFLMATLAVQAPITVEDWRWALLVGAVPVPLGLIALFVVPESPRWLAARAAAALPPLDPTAMVSSEMIAAGRAADPTPPKPPVPMNVFRSPLLGVTLIAIVLATIPMIGGWGTANWMIPWAEKAGQGADSPRPRLKAQVQQTRALTGIVGSLLGGWIASMVGRRRTYFLVSVASLALAQYIFWWLLPTDESFLIWVGVLGFVSGIYFGWLPLCLPELFPTRVRSTGAGVGFNFGRIVTAVTLFLGGVLMGYFEGDYARLGRVTSLLFVFGIVFIWFAPDTSEKNLAD